MLRRWDRLPHIIAAKYSVPPTEQDLRESDEDWAAELAAAQDLAWRELLIAEKDGRAIGFVAIDDPAEEETHYWGDCEPNLRAVDIWLGDPADTGRGYGTEIMRQALARCFAPPQVTAIVIDPLATNARAIRFYEQLGFGFVENRTFGTDQCAVYRLERARWQG